MNVDLTSEMKILLFLWNNFTSKIKSDGLEPCFFLFFVGWATDGGAGCLSAADCRRCVSGNLRTEKITSLCKMSEALSYILQLKPVCWGRSQNRKCHIIFCGKVNKCVFVLWYCYSSIKFLLGGIFRLFKPERFRMISIIIY